MEQHGRRAAGGGGRKRRGGTEERGRGESHTGFLEAEWIADSSHKVRTSEDVTHSKSWLTPLKEDEGGGERDIRCCMKMKVFIKDTKRKNI